MVRDPGKVAPVFDPLGFFPADVVVGDMTDTNAVETALSGCDGVVHTAALVDMRRAAANLVESANARGVETIVGGAARRGIPSIVYVSSLMVFFQPGGPPMSPTSAISPGTTAYARSKSRSELYVRRLQEEGAAVRISYPAGIVGPQDPGPSALNAALASFMKQGWLITSSGLQIVDVRDLAALHVRLLELADGQHRFVAASTMMSWAQWYELACFLTGKSIRRIKVPGAVLRAAGTAGDIVKRIHDFDFPMTRDGMEVATRWPGAETERTTRELGVAFREPAESLRDALAWMYTAGHLTAAQAGKLGA
jgi:nucleoside-diphosphate-sugar epimerase